MVGARHAMALNSATAGLHLALEAVGVGPGSAVLVSPYTFAASAEVARYLGADPVFVDIDRNTMNIDPAALGETLEKLGKAGRRVSAIMPVHVAGLPCDMDAIGHLSRRARRAGGGGRRARISRSGGRPLCRHHRGRRCLLLLRHQADHYGRGRHGGHRPG